MSVTQIRKPLKDMSTPLNIWIVEGRSESGDYYQEIFGHEPSDHELTELAFSWDGDRTKPWGPGFAGSWVHITTEHRQITE